ncbi:hypothetical protein HPB49_008204 [Dermacentor silvarum]|uniref:Uncharacterized protein n=1 Tax=Dermacentor silvarum TaxID=543639 RepID=A0ACB8DBK3_DERSI|nr:hypothetical protein HPB49_008204 [Dermacentor silvarum]
MCVCASQVVNHVKIQVARPALLEGLVSFVATVDTLPPVSYSFCGRDLLFQKNRKHGAADLCAQLRTNPNYQELADCMQSPCPRSLNYGAIGGLIAHEMFHAFDASGQTTLAPA